MQFKVTNWSDYEAGLRRRGSLTLWLTEEALAGWHASRRTTRCGQPRYSDLAIETVLTLGCVFGLCLRQSEGLMTSLRDLMGLDLPVPDHTTLSRRAQIWEPAATQKHRAEEDGPLHVLVDSTGLKIYGAGQWLEDKHGTRARRTWRKLHLALDADSGEIIAHCLTEQVIDDPSQLEPLLDQIDAEIDQFTADGAYDGDPAYRSVLKHSATARVVIPPRITAVESDDTGPSGQRDDHIRTIANDGRLKWQTATGYGKRALIETAIGRYKGLIGRRLGAAPFRLSRPRSPSAVPFSIACSNVDARSPSAAGQRRQG